MSREIAALAGEWYRRRVGVYGDEFVQDIHEEIALQLFRDDPTIFGAGDPDQTEFIPEAINRQLAADLLRQHGFATDPDSVQRLVVALVRAQRAFVRLLRSRVEGDWSPDPNLPKFPVLTSRKTPEAGPKLTFQALVAAWAAETGTAGKALYDRQRTANLLSTFLGHEDTARVTADDVVRWKEARLAAGRSTKTVANDIGELRPIWNWARLNRKLAFAENPFAGLAPRTNKRGRRVRGPYTEGEARQILTAAHAETDASLRWLPWVLCFTGARLGEITQAVREDIQREGGGPWFIHIHAEGEGRKLKTINSERMVPLHPSLIVDGFLRYVEALPVGASLFGNLRPDTFGTLKGTATKKHGRWVRRTVGKSTRPRTPLTHGAIGLKIRPDAPVCRRTSPMHC